MTVRWALLDGGMTVQVKDGAERIFMTRQEAVQLAKELLGNLAEPVGTHPRSWHGGPACGACNDQEVPDGR